MKTPYIVGNGLKLRDGFELGATEAAIVEEAHKMKHLLLTNSILLFQTHFYKGMGKIKYREWV